jgi:hypothetical protein
MRMSPTFTVTISEAMASLFSAPPGAMAPVERRQGGR